MKRIREVITDIRNQFPNDSFFSEFESDLKINQTMIKYYESYNRALMVLDNESWKILKEKALQHYLDHRKGQEKQGFFNQLNEAFAYRYLVNSKGFENVQFVKEGKGKTPDIIFTVKSKQMYCEVKTLNISDAEINRRSTSSVCDGSVYKYLSNGFLNKFKYAVNSAWQQINTFGTNGLVYIIIHFDDFPLFCYQNYRKQLIEFSEKQGFDYLFIKVGVLGNKRICITSGL